MPPEISHQEESEVNSNADRAFDKLDAIIDNNEQQEKYQKQIDESFNLILSIVSKYIKNKPKKAKEIGTDKLLSTAAKITYDSLEKSGIKLTAKQKKAVATLIDDFKNSLKKPGKKKSNEKKPSLRSDADDSFDKLDKFKSVLSTFEDPNIPFKEKMEALKSIMKDGERVSLGFYKLARKGEKIYFMTGPTRGVALTEAIVNKLLANAKRAKKSLGLE